MIGLTKARHENPGLERKCSCVCGSPREDLDALSLSPGIEKFRSCGGDGMVCFRENSDQKHWKSLMKNNFWCGSRKFWNVHEKHGFTNISLRILFQTTRESLVKSWFPIIFKTFWSRVKNYFVPRIFDFFDPNFLWDKSSRLLYKIWIFLGQATTGEHRDLLWATHSYRCIFVPNMSSFGEANHMLSQPETRGVM